MVSNVEVTNLRHADNIEAQMSAWHFPRLEDPFTGQRLASFLLLHSLAFSAEIAAMILFGFTHDWYFLTALIIPFLFSGLFCAHAAWHCDAPVSGSRFLPLKERPLPLALLLELPLGFGQGVIVMLALEEYWSNREPRSAADTPGSDLPRQSSIHSSTPVAAGPVGRRPAPRPVVNKYHCKAINGLFEGLLSTAVLLYAFWSMGVPEEKPITKMWWSHERSFVGVLASVLFLSSGLGLMEMDYCTSRSIAKKISRSWRYEVLHLLFRTCEVTSRVCLFVAFMVATRQTVVWWWIPLAADFAITVLLVNLFGGAESTWQVRILCSVPCVFANVFAFIDSPYKRRAARRISLWMTLKQGSALVILPTLMVIATPDLGSEISKNWYVHKSMICLAVLSTITHWILLWYVSSTTMRRSNMADIYTACERGDAVAVRSAMRELTHSAAVCLNVNSFDIDGNTLLMLAAERGHARVCSLLVREGARVDLKHFQDDRSVRHCLVKALRRRWTALHLAAVHGHLEVVQVLLEAAGLSTRRPSLTEADIQAMRSPTSSHSGGHDAFKDQQGETPLHLAARAGWVNVCCLLAVNCPDWADTVSANGQRPIDLARVVEVQQAISSPSTELLGEVSGSGLSSRSSSGRLPLLSGRVSREQGPDDAWPQVQLSIARSSRTEQLMAPGLCSYLASSCGGALGRVFLDKLEPLDHVRPSMSFLTDISEASDESSWVRAHGESTTPWAISIQDNQPPPAAPSMEDLEPADHREQPVEWWVNMVQSQHLSVGPSSSGRNFTRVPPEATLGAGSYGLVWRAREKFTGKIYAVKNITQRQGMSTREYEVADFIRLKPHPCLVQLFLVHNFQDAGLYVLVMEFCSGGDLLGCIKRQRERTGPGAYEPPAQAILWIGQVFLGLEHMHLRMDTLLRDLKPENVVLNDAGCAKLTDFGFGKFGVESSGGWSFGMPTGSPGYVAPEVLRQEVYDYRADLYSLGVLVWVVMTGGLLNKRDPLPPIGRMRFQGQFSAHFRDCEMLVNCLTHPEANGARSLGSLPHDFVTKLVRRRPVERMRHDAIRQHSFLKDLKLPPYDAHWSEVDRWVRSEASRFQV
eukprot:TRINITY_DN50028_c0_g1_i1.p1 TRINITY_DN50028_c0_g1~~TRINITY_DN50028_c0_g1_i1.p1  ORF type:complete len:1105 (+),score=179.75 TRINITY_DN50028_c0_g1_i1:37-3315(+)